MFDSPTPASSSSSTLVSATDSTSTQSPIPTSYATDTKAIVSEKTRPKLGLNTSLSSTTRLGSNSPKMSDKGFIEPHASHLPRRIKGPNKRERTKTAPVSTSHNAQDQGQLQQQQQQLEEPQLERLREQLQLYQQGTTLESPSETLPDIVEVDPSHSDPLPPPKPPQVSTHPHRDNLPRRTRFRERSNTVPMNASNTRTRRIPSPLPISIGFSQSTIGADTRSQMAVPQESDADEEADSLTSLNPPPFRLNSKALSLISKAQNKAFKSHIVIDNDGPDQQSPPMPTSPQLPHPAMGLTMGIMEAYATEEKDEAGIPMGAHAIVRHGLSYSPALGVRGTPPPPLPSSTFFPVHTPKFVPVPASAPILTSSTVPIISITAPSPNLGLTPPVSAPLGKNLPRRHNRCRPNGPQMEGEEKEKEVLRLERVRVVNGTKGNRVERNEEEDGLFSSLLDFERAGSLGVGQATGATTSHCVGRGEDERCIQVLGRSCVEVGYMLESERKGKEDYVLVEVIGDDGGLGGGERRLELYLQDDAAVCKEGVPSLLPEQVRAGCEFMKGWIGCEEGTRKIRISVPRWRAQDAFGLAVCFLVWAEAGEKPKVDDEGVYTPMHLLYMGLLDEGEGDEREWDGKGKDVVGLGISGVEFGIEEGESVHSDATTGSSRPASVGARGGGTGLRDEWRGVLSYDGLNFLSSIPSN